jgi:hypothetical protein
MSENVEQARRQLLIQSIRNRLVPALTMRGFELAPSIARSSVDREFEQSFPSWGRLIRGREPGIDRVEIQLAKYGRAAFRISAGVVPKAGLMTPAGHRDAKEVNVQWLEEYFETHARPWLRPLLAMLRLEPLGAWFSVWPPRSVVASDYDQLAARAAALVPQIDRALQEGVATPNLRKVVIQRTAA